MKQEGLYTGISATLTYLYMNQEGLYTGISATLTYLYMKHEVSIVKTPNPSI